MHLIELIEKNTFVAIAEYSVTNGQFAEIVAVKFCGWITVSDNIKDRVRIIDILSVNVPNIELNRPDKADSDAESIYISAKMKAEILKLEEFVADSIIVVHDVSQSGFCKIKKILGICQDNRLLDTAMIAKVNFRNKIKDYSLSCLAHRFCPQCKLITATEKTKAIAYLIGQLALEDDFSHCGY